MSDAHIGDISWSAADVLVHVRTRRIKRTVLKVRKDDETGLMVPETVRDAKSDETVWLPISELKKKLGVN